MATKTDTQTRTMLSRARSGDRAAFSRLIEPYRREIIAYCYRLSGSLVEAEDLAQESFVRAYRAMGSFEGRASVRAWLYKIAHNLCVNHVQRDRPNWESLSDLPEDSMGQAEAAEDSGQEREDVRLGFVALVHSLPPRQRAALVLRDVLGWSAEETARILGTTVPGVKNALARARQTLANHPQGADPAGVQDLAANDPAARAMVSEWVDAFEKGNTVKMVALLTEDHHGLLAQRRATDPEKPETRGARRLQQIPSATTIQESLAMVATAPRPGRDEGSHKERAADYVDRVKRPPRRPGD